MNTTSLEGRTLVGEGRTAEIYEWGEGRVLRLYRAGASQGWVQRELRAFQGVSEAGIPSPTVYPADSDDGLLETDGRLGFVMDRVDGPTMLHCLTRQPWKLWAYASMLANLHVSMHRQATTSLPSQRERFHRVIDGLGEQLNSETIELLHEALEELDDATVICHGDFHPDNVILSDQGPIIIDWGPATAGAPAADVAWTVHLFKNGGTPPGMARGQRLMLALLRRMFLFAYRRAYVGGSTLRWRDVAQWKDVNAAIRLGDGIPEEQEGLLRTLRRFEAKRARRASRRGKQA